MLLRKCSWEQLNKSIEGNKVIIFGVGSNYRYCIEPALSETVRNNVAYAIDNNPSLHSVSCGTRILDVYGVDKLVEEQECAVLLCGLDHLYEMYQQLEQMRLPDTIECYPVPLFLAEFCGSEDTALKGRIFNSYRLDKIPRVIHTFWFSGEDISDEYRACLDSWKRLCPDYNICIWNTETYDITKSHFVESAVKERKWAFASDYARLDILNRFGGIYMDLDVELERNLNVLLGNEAFFTFEAGNEIEPAVIGARPAHPILKILIDVYKNLEFRNNEALLKEYCMPHLMREKFEGYGVKMDGSMQLIDGAAFLPRKYFCPMDNVVYQNIVKTDETIGIHLMNGAWKASGLIEKKRENNRKLHTILNNMEQGHLNDET